MTIQGPLICELSGKNVMDESVVRNQWIMFEGNHMNVHVDGLEWLTNCLDNNLLDS